MADKVFIKIHDALYVRVDEIAYFHVTKDTLSPDKYATIFLNRSQSGDRLHLNKEQADRVMAVLETLC